MPLGGVGGGHLDCRTVIALDRGMNDLDSLAYHLPSQSRSARAGTPINTVSWSRRYPWRLSCARRPAFGNRPHTHSLRGLRSGQKPGLRRSVVVAAHALGKAFGGLGLTSARAEPFWDSRGCVLQPGEAVTDTLLLLVLVGALAVLAHAWDRPAPYVLALACAGLALGVKFWESCPARSLPYSRSHRCWPGCQAIDGAGLASGS